MFEEEFTVEEYIVVFVEVVSMDNVSVNIISPYVVKFFA